MSAAGRLGEPIPAPADSTRPRAEPIRTCVGCRRRESRSVLVRVVLDGDRMIVDRAKSAPGRGAWLHPAEECLELALKRKAFHRALRAAHADASALVSAEIRLG